jgi:hypothetical protein
MIEERVAALEKQMKQLLQPRTDMQTGKTWLQQWAGAFKDSPYFDSAMKRGAAYRRAQSTAAYSHDYSVGLGSAQQRFFLRSNCVYAGQLDNPPRSRYYNSSDKKSTGTKRSRLASRTTQL